LSALGADRETQVLNEVALVHPDGNSLGGCYDGYGRVCTDDVDILIFESVKEADSDTGNTGDASLVHQVCLREFVEKYVVPGREFMFQARDPKQGFFHSAEELRALGRKVRENGRIVRPVLAGAFQAVEVLASLTSNEYVSRVGDSCPQCKSQDLCVGEAVQTGRAFTERPVKCLTCGATWKDRFILHGYTDLKLSEMRA